MRHRLDNMVYRGNVRTIVFVASVVSAGLTPLDKTCTLFGFFFLAAGCMFRYLTKATLVRNHVLCRDGLYGIVRHPYYMGNFIIDSSLCLLTGNPVLLYAYPFLFFWAYGTAFKREEQFLYERYPEEYSRYLLDTPQVLPSSDARFSLSELLPHLSRQRVSNKEWARMASAWSSAMLILFIHRLFIDGFHRISFMLADAYSLMLVATILVLALTSLVLHRKPELTQVLDDVSELMRGLRNRPDGLRTSPALEELACRIRRSLDRFGRHNIEVGQCATFFDRLVDAMEKGPCEAEACEEYSIIELIEQSFQAAKRLQVDIWSTRKSEAAERASQSSCSISVEDEDGQPLSEAQIAGLTLEWEPAVASYAFHALSRACIIRGDASVRISVIPDCRSDPSQLRVRFTTRSRRPLPGVDELRKAFFTPGRHAAGNLGPFLVRHLLREYCGGDLDIVDSEIARGYLGMDLTFPIRLRGGGEPIVEAIGMAVA